MIEYGVFGGVVVAVATLFFADSFPSSSLVHAAFWPTNIIAHALGKMIYRNDQANIVIWLPVHLLCWSFIGGVFAFIYARIFRKRHRPR